jgi:general secretion pathway protein A
MYEQFFELRERPFELTPNPRFLVMTPRHREALSNLFYGISSGKGVTVLIGDAGTGKTTLLRAVLDGQLQGDTLCVHLNNPTLTRDEFLELLARGFGLSESASGSKARLLIELQQLLEERRAKGALTVVVIDEAQSLSHELLEEVRLLANMETADRKLLSVVLAGQPELAVRLNDNALRQLKQRVALRCELAALTLAETEAYVARRVSIAGGNASRIFTREAIGAVHRASAGIPRLISVICDNALVTAFALQVRPVSQQIVEDVCRDFDLDGRSENPAPKPSAAPSAQILALPRRAANDDAQSRERATRAIPSWFGLLSRGRVS